ncbi:MAG: choice-of-anchor D domain-containing protein, partial [Verrucomicrobiales bacterium]|nr:choice-of-anchor D domain-containing protein [Verrucomicrobiales bacterium]
MPHTPFIDSLSRIARGFCLSLGLISILNGTFVPASLAVDPDIQVEQPLGNALVSGVSVLNFGGMSIGGTPVVRQFTVRNIVPAATLGLGSVSVSGAAADDFSLNLAGMAGSISSDTTTFSVTYYPSQTGTRSAVLTIANTDPDESPFVISLTGSSTSAAPPSQSVEAPVALGAHCIGDGPFVLPVVATSGLPVSVEITAGAAVGSVSGRTFTPSGIPGPVTIKISQPGGGGYDAATPIYRSFSVVADRFAKLFQSGVAGQAAGIKEDGTLWMWGAGSGGQLGVGSTSNSRLPLKVGTDTNWGTVSPGGNHTLALKTDGTIWGWGINSTYQLGIGNNVQKTSPERIGTGTNWVAISAGSFHSMGIKSDGSLWAWGQNSSYQLGLGDTTTRTTPTRVGTDNDWIAVAAGSSHTIALRSDHTLWAWGSNTSGQLGVGDLTTRTTPTQVGLDTDWAKVVATTSTSYAIRSTGTLWGWGGNGSYNLGLGSTGNRNLPTQIGIFNDWIAIAPCGSSCAGLRSDHSLWTWGSGSLTGQTASGTTSTRTSPIQVGTDKDWASAAAIVSNLYLLKTDGTIWAVGANSSGQLAAPNNNPSYLAGGGIRAIGHGGSSTHYIRNDGTMWAIGTNYPNVGYPAGSTGNQPTQIGTDSDWAAVAAASGHTLALKTDGTLWGAGSSSSGQLGNGSTGTLSVFTRIGTDTNWAKIAVGTVFSAGIKTDGSLWAWGSNTSGQLGLGNQTSTTSITRVGTANDWAAVACGGSHMAVLKTNGSLWTCGSNSFGQLGLGDTVQRTSLTQAAGTGWSDVACGTSHILLKKTNGQIWSTGLNANGQLGDGTFSSRSSPVQIGADSDWVMIMTGSTHSVALKANGDLWGWGSNGYGQLVGASGSSINTPLLLTTLGRYALLGNGSQSIHTVVARQDGSLWGFGANADHQLTNNVRMSSILTYAYPTISEQSVTQATVSVVTYGSATPLNGTATSGLPVSYVVSGPASVADGEITVTGPGPVRLVAYQNGDASTWHNAPPIEVTVELPPWAEALPADNVAKTSATVYGNAYGDNVAT